MKKFFKLVPLIKRYGGTGFLVMTCVVLPLATWQGYLAIKYFEWPIPHVVYTYTFHDNGDPYNPLAERRYITCTYWHPSQSVRVAADHGKCPWMRFFTNSDLLAASTSALNANGSLRRAR